MAKNTCEIQEVSPGQIRTLIETSDGCTMMEMHRPGLSDQDVLMKLNQKHYKQYAGTWMITFPREHKVFSEMDIGTVVQKALAYIYERDNPNYPDYFC